MRPIIFDCDGTLVDSERVYAKSNAAVFARYGAIAAPDELFARYTGVSLTAMAADIETRFGVTLTPRSATNWTRRQVYCSRRNWSRLPGFHNCLPCCRRKGVRWRSPPTAA
ncbi:HAD hydrolase-like protein [Hankyongella ginsenosidimutans]|uniref:HAD hydrolase-like protein n=1 Tax=Hankyongella ginsenosidimutans TaxID=1763828 RepID=UPI001FE5898D|nr:HAD hydrolase-like protein [Hankyongella ginsenosidimutans]